MQRWPRRNFPGEFSWRLFVVIQCSAFLAFAYLLIGESSAGRPLFRLQYKTIYEKVEADPAVIEAARAHCSHLSDDPNHPQAQRSSIIDPFTLKPLSWSPRELCFNREKPPSHRMVGSQFAGIQRVNGLLLLALVGALLAPFIVFRIGLWLLAGWRAR